MELSPGAQKRHDARTPRGEFGLIQRVLLENEDWYWDLVQHSQDILGIHDLQGRVLSINPLPARVLGYSVEELLQIPLRHIVAEQFRPQFDQYLKQIATASECHGYLTVMTRSGERRIWQYHSSVRTEGVAEPVVRVMAHDVTEQKRAEKLLRASHEKLLRTTHEQESTLRELKLFRALLDESNDAIQVIEPETLRLLDVNDRTCLQLGYSREELLAMTIYDIAPDFDQELRSKVLEQIRDSGSAIIERVHRRKDGSAFPVEVTLREVRLDRTYGIAVTRDISARKRAQAQLQASENRYRALHDRSPAGICWVETRTGRFLGVNPKFCEIAGRTEQDLLARNLQSITHPDDVPGNLERLRQLADKEVPGYAFEKRYIRPDGSIRWVELEVVAMPQASDDPDWLMAIVEDITDRRAQEQRLREYERVVEGLEEMIVVLDRDYRHVIANRAFLSRLGMEKHEVLGRHVREVLNDGIFESVVKQKVDECFKGTIVRYELKYTYPKLGERDLVLSYYPIEGPTGIDRIACVLEDVTERRRAEHALRESEDRAESILDSVTDMHVSFDRDWRHIYVNRAGAAMVGLPREQILGKNMWELFPDLAGTEMERQGRRAMDLRVAVAFDFYHPSRDLWLDCRLYPTPQGLSVFTTDITQRKRAEEALRESEARERAKSRELEAVLEALPIAVCIAHDIDCLHMTGNRAAHEQLAVPLGSNISLSAAAEDRPAFRLLENGAEIPPELMPIQQAAATGKPVYGRPLTVLLPNGSKRETIANVVPLLDEQARPRGAVAASIDVTEQKQAEEALRRSEQRFRVALAGSPIKVFNQDRDLRYTWVYNLQEGWSEKDYLGKTDAEIFDPEVAERMTAMKRSVLESGCGIRTEFPLEAHGKTYHCDITVEPLVDASGSVVGVNCACVDVTHLREISEELRLAKEKLSEEKLYLEQTIDSELGFGEIIGRSRGLKEVMQKVASVAPSGAAVLLLGETGTGKELVARAIHRMSKRQENSFIKMNCAAIPSSLLESELFGHEKGAFTGSVSRKIGRLELADQGTLFLDEIGEIPLELQPKLLRVLQDREFERLGGIRTINVDFRLVAATNRDLRKSVNEQQFRSDLYYRLNVFPIHIPPLRERREDIPLLVEHFVHKYAERMSKSIASIPAKTMDALVSWPWPGNIRELENFLERSVILTRGSVLQAPLGQLDAQPDMDKDTGATLRERERAQILRALRECRGQIGGPEGAAVRLGLKRTTLQSKLGHFSIKPEEYRE